MDQKVMKDQITAACCQSLFHRQDLTVTDQNSAPQQAGSDDMSSQSKWVSSSPENPDLVLSEDRLSNGTRETETLVALHCPGDGGDVAAGSEHLALSNDGMSEFSNSDLSLPEVCISTNSNSFEDDLNYEVQQAYRIFTGFLLDKHKAITSPFLHPIGHHDAQHGIEGVQGRVQSQLRQSMCLRRIEEKFTNQEYETITEFVADFRLMLENCYRYHGVDHWISKQAQKLEIMLEQKLTLLSRTLREKTALAVTSKGRFGAEEERGSGGTSTRRRLAPRSLATITVGGHESIMVQALRLEEQQRAKEEKRQRELEKKEAEEMSAKEVEEWEQSLRSQASPHTVDTLWELPAIGHFLCLAQTALNLPEIVFFELERCLLMPRCSLLLSKIMSSLLSPPQRRATLHRRPALPYRRWESELRQRVMGWYRAVGNSHDQRHRADQLGLCQQLFSILGEVNPLEEKPFHLLHFYHRIWLLKGLCDHVYETQKDVQDAVLAQPIHECRESILGYDSKENAYIHFPHFCGADLRIYCQSPSTPPAFPFPSILVKRVEFEAGTEGEESDGIKNEGDKNNRACDGTPMDMGGPGDFGKRTIDTPGIFKKENGSREEDKNMFHSWSLIKEETSDSGSCDGDDCEDSKFDLKIHSNPLSIRHCGPVGGGDVKMNINEETVDVELKSKQEQGFSLGSERTIKAETQDPCLNVGEHSYTGRSPARSVNLGSPAKPLELKMEEVSRSRGHTTSLCLECCKGKISNAKSAEHVCCCGTSGRPTQLSSESTQNSSEERASDKMWTKKKKRKKKRMREQLLRLKRERKHSQHADGTRRSPAEAAKSAVCKVATTIKRKDKKKKHKTGKKTETLTTTEDEPPSEPSFKLVCTSLDELRELISKTEDELDDLESTKNRLGRWYYRREAVKDLHSTLIRLLNELSPWEPKLVKAYQRNRLRLKKEFDDFKKHPEYNNFVREECASSSSDDDYDDDEGDFEKDRRGESEEEDLEHIVPRGLWSGASTREFGAEAAAENTVTCIPPNHLKHRRDSSEKSAGILPREQGVSTNIVSANLREELRSELIPTNQSRDLAWATGTPAHTTASPTSPILPTTSGLPKGYTPIPTLLAKSVGNKVTLMKRPTDFLGVSRVDGQRKGSLVPAPTCAVMNTKVSKAHISPSSSQQNLQKMTAQRPHQMQVIGQPGIAKATLPNTPPSQSESKNPVQVIYKVPEGLGQLVKKDSSSPVMVSVHSAVEHNTAEKVMQQVVILPSNLLLQKNEAKPSSLNPQQSKGIQVAVSKVASPVCISTNVPGFSIPENKIPVQQVAPLKDGRTGRTTPISVSSRLQQGIMNTAGFKGSQVGCVQARRTQCGMPTPSPTTNLSSSVSTETVKSSHPKQELKTVCIRDSQSILVTTRGGNTGIVKVQTSSDQNALGAFSTSPVITISPQFKAFLVSKSSTTLSSSGSSQTSPSTLPALTGMSVAQPQKQAPLVLKSPFTVTNSMPSTVTSCPPVTSPGSQTTGPTFAVSQGSSISAGSTVDTKISQLALPATAGSPFPASKLNNTAVVSSVSSSGVPQVFKQEFISKTAVKRASTDEGHQVNKYILVTPSSSLTSSVATSKGTPSTTVSVPSSRITFFSQPIVTSSPTFVGSIPKQVMATGNSGHEQTTSLSSQTLRMGISPVQPVAGVSSEALSTAKNITLPSGVQIQLSGKLTTIGQNIGVLSHSPSKAAPVSVSGTCSPTAATTTGLVPVTGLMTVASCSPQLGTSVTTHSPLMGIPSISVKSHTICSTSSSTAATMPAGNMNKNYLGTLANTLSNSSPAHVTTTIGSGLAQTPTPTLDCKPSYNQSGISEENMSLLLSSQLHRNKAQIPLSSAQTTSNTGTVQQRIIINTSTPLAAGTQILLNNARFVVPPQGLGTGSHVLIISSPAPQVPSASPTSTGASVLPKGVSHASVTPRAPVLPQSAARMPGVPAVSSPFVACTPTIGPPLQATAPHVTPFRLTGTPSMGSTLISSKTNVVSALSKLPAVYAGNFALPPVGSSTLVSSPSRLGTVPALVSPVISSTPALSLAPSTNRVTQAECSSTKSSAVAPPLLKSSRPLSSLPVIPSPSVGALHSPFIPVPGPLSTAAASVVADAPVFHCSPPAQQMVAVTALGPSMHPQQTTVRVAAPSTVHQPELVHQGPGNISIKKQVPVMQSVLAGTRTQVLPTVAVPPIVSALSRTQALPIATVPPIGSTVSSFETAPVAVASPSSTSVIINPAQAIPSQISRYTIPSPVILTNQALGKRSVQTSSLSMHTNVTSKLLISPDGAVLSTVHCQVNPAELTACPKPLDALVTSSNSSTGALQTHDSALQPPHTNTK
ncbi:putative bromodomain-containing protein 10 [Odontesthes bonariensis]|uniref:putative bromodomain-containing protein 10 n=1 Tax=Odontesthes bonariensis TaxID=219752 RepID=UPI003F58B5BC